MKKRNDTVRYTGEQLDAMRQRGESRTDWTKVDAMTEAELEASIAADPDDVHEAPDWSQAVLGLPPRKEHINIRIDSDVLAWFRRTGRATRPASTTYCGPSSRAAAIRANDKYGSRQTSLCSAGNARSCAVDSGSLLRCGRNDDPEEGRVFLRCADVAKIRS